MAKRPIPPFDWAAIKAEWERVASESGVTPDKVTRNQMRAAGYQECFAAYKESARLRGAKTFSDARRELFPPSVPAPVYPDRHEVRGVSTLVGPDGEIRAQWIKTRAEQEQREDLLRRLLEEIPEVVPARGQVPLEDFRRRSDLLSVYPMGDPHVGMLCWHGDAGDDFDLERAELQLDIAARYLTNAGAGTRKAAIINLGDFFHSDSQENRTRRSGHQLDVDTRYAKIARAGLRIMISMAEFALRRHEEVTVINSVGNHDDHTSLWLSVAMDAHFRDEPRLTVDLSPAKFHYLRHGKVLIGVTHGDTVKPPDLEGIMAHDCAEQWSETEYRHWFCGHIHHRRVHEFRNCTVESFRTLAPRDAYAQGHGYRSRRDMQKIVFSEEFGEISRVIADHRLIGRLMERRD